MGASAKKLNPEPKLPRVHGLWLKTLRAPFRYLLVFAHMRSGSTLLVHLLNSSPQIIGYGESKTLYCNEADFDTLLSKVSLFFGKIRLSEKYVMDKIVQDELFVKTDLLHRPDVQCIFLLRDATQTLPSITDMYIRVFPQLHANWTGGENEALEYYQSRLNKLARLAEEASNGNKPILVTYDEILSCPEEVFKLLQNSLGIDNNFSDNYSIHKATGVPVIGDFSQEIRTGKIQRSKRRPEREISQHLIEKGECCYREAILNLRKCCQSISPTLGVDNAFNNQA